GIHHFELQQRHDDAFDVESLNKEFYNKIAIAFTKLVGGKRKVGSRTEEFEPLLKLPSSTDHQKMQEFAVRLIGRLVFCWFLKKKEGHSKIPLIPESVLSKDSINSKYYHSILEPLFFEVLNTPFDDRLDKFQTDNWENIPFLNGGLFEPNREDFYETDDVIHQSKYLNTLNIPDNWFTELFEIFEGYNFTIEENTSIDIDLSIDPEILGRIFENLLAEINPETGETARKNTGSYYTPRPIVDYMVDESIKQYLFTNTDIDDSKITQLLSYTDETDLSQSEKKVVLNALDKIKIIDPACGSGAFPMGILQKMTLILQKIDPESIEWLIKQLDRIPDKNVRDEVETKLRNENWNYIHKLGIIQNSIYGVDIQPIAVEISKLRFFLSLIVDEKVDDDKPNRGLKPLPNLEFKFVCANSLIGLPESENDADQVGMFTDTFFEDFSQAVNDYFNASNPVEKHKVREKIEALIDKKTDEKFETIQAMNKQITTDPRRLKERKQKTAELTQLMTLWSSYKNLFKNEPVGFFDIQYFFPKCKDGFDVVIANPPYLKERGNAKVFKLVNESDFGKKYHQGKMDFWYYFLHKSIDIKSPSGCISFITPRYWIASSGAKKLINRVGEELRFINVLDIGKVKVFNNVIGQHMVSIYESKNDNNVTIYKKVIDSLNDIFSTTDTDQISVNQINSNKINQIDEIKFEFSSVDICKNDVITIGEIVECSQGVVEAPDKISRKVYENNPVNNISIGDGVFVINQSERLSNGFSNDDFIKPYLDPNSVGRYFINHNNEFLIYSDKTIKDEIEKGKYCEVKNHLDKFAPFITSSNKPYGIHRARKQKYFDSPKLICKGMFKKPDFTYDDEKYYVGFSFTVMVEKDSNFLLKYILAILNSKISNYWFIYNGKKRGIGFDIGVTKFRQFPIVKTDLSNQQKLELIVDQIITAKKANPQADTTALEQEIDKMVYELYGLTKEEIQIVEESVNG
ncbi:MAG: Eco57I restriction-modification methylase domain-containing protein, partial [Bacteroidetes bacterium]|nr:Eco57I restriction-modification methylase domain-containing protein [Bacteroidota bacterium]